MLMADQGELSAASNGGIPNNNSSANHDHQRSKYHRELDSLMSSCYPITLKFIDVCYRIKLENKSTGGCISRILTGGQQKLTSNNNSQERTILNGVTGMVSPGEILAVLGPSGSGKSTLLNAIAGRLQKKNCYTGSILANGRKLTKPILRRTGFVTQDDVLYPHLTVKETLVFCSLLRLPNSLSKKEKTIVAESVINELGLGKCENTIIGNSFIRGVSGGERKRVSIGHEMLVNPSLLLLDEPTSGLDSTAAHRLVLTLGSLAQKGKTIVTSMHQPSSRIFQMFHSVLVLCEGRCIYFGKGSNAMDYFGSIGFSPSFPMNPADFLLDLANGVCQYDGQVEGDKSTIKQTLVSSYNNLLAPIVKASCIDSSINGVVLGSPKFLEDNKRRINSTNNNNNNSYWFHQFSILLQRSLKERRHESFNSLRVFQVIAAAILAGSMWFHSNIHDVQDRLGLLFFIAIFWGVLPSFNAVFAFPQDRAIFIKERSSGMYTLSTYFMARIVGDLPMELILPTVFITATYWMSGLNPDFGSFLLTLGVLLGYVMVAQGLGLALGAAIMDAKQASTVVTVTMLAFVLTGGFYVHKVPACLAWLKYTSFTYYCFRLFIDIQYGDEGNGVSPILGCYHHNSMKAANCRLIMEGDVRPMVSIGVLVFMFVGYRLLAYAALRRMKA
ncbi:ABC transporter-like [Macleaya cordata]|uniref:ABC transporter-like n=1 Tax=Macleaya cordata TaxID=56857 RepID=A0A200Q0U0_MACCD|nr:ABC transporter-like [Macleaya cordata]